MTVDPISIYSNQSVGSETSRDGGFFRQAISAQVSTRTVGVQLGKLGVSLSTQNISFADEPAPKVLLDFAREMELQFLTQHVRPFQPSGSFAHNATAQRLGASAYAAQQACCRSVTPMISVRV